MNFKEAVVDTWESYLEVLEHLRKDEQISRSFRIIKQRLFDIIKSFFTITGELFWWMLWVVCFFLIPLAVFIRMVKKDVK